MSDLRCEYTGNPCDTDTLMRVWPGCPCVCCRIWMRERIEELTARNEELEDYIRQILPRTAAKLGISKGEQDE